MNDAASKGRRPNAKPGKPPVKPRGQAIAAGPVPVSPYKVGDAVTLTTSRGGAEALLTVTGFSHGGRCLETSDGGQWRNDGKRRWRDGDGFYHGPWLEPTSSADADRVRRRRLVGLIRKFTEGLSVDSDIATDDLAAIVDLFDARRSPE